MTYKDFSNILDPVIPNGGDLSKMDDPKAVEGIKDTIESAKEYIKKAKESGRDAAFSFWQVFEAVYRGKIELDAWSDKVYYKGQETTRNRLIGKLEKTLEMSHPRASEGFYGRMLDMMLEGYKFQPVKRYLDDVYRQFMGTEEFNWLPEWDSLGSILFGVNDPLTQEMITTFLIGAVKRALDPGCVMKRSLILKGDQDAGKSAFVEILAKGWSTELAPETKNADMIRLCRSTWIMELSECDRLFKGKEAAELKALLSTKTDSYIPKFKEADEASVTPRITLFIGTTNKSQFLVDDTGNKRFWVIDSPSGWKYPLSWLESNIDHIWACAYHKLTQGHNTDLSEEGIRASELRNQTYMIEGAWIEQIEAVLFKATHEGKTPIAFKAVDLMYALGIRGESQGRAKYAIVNSLKQLNYVQKPKRTKGGVQKLYTLPDVKATVAYYDPDRLSWIYVEKPSEDPKEPEAPKVPKKPKEPEAPKVPEAPKEPLTIDQMF